MKAASTKSGAADHAPTTKAAAMRLVPAASRTIAILRLLAMSDEPLTLKQISSELKIVPSSCLHILRVLVAESLLVLEPGTKRYQIGIGVLTFASKAMGQDRLLGFLQQETDGIARKYDICAFATKLDGDRCFVVAVSLPRNTISIHAQLGSRYPVYMGATGICYAALSEADPKAVYQKVKSGKWASLPKQADWLANVQRCRKLGYAIDRENYAAGMTLITAPVLSRDGRITHTLTAAIIGRVTGKSDLDDIGRTLLASTNKLLDFVQ
ncbi:IclR family transcriptional regulator [Ferrovibrio sp.]|uniref:IclR family transcriptional regulator n=1 Tax=Ferrovibrio sp. TaxID=1917215 RepID=UPI003D09D590